MANPTLQIGSRGDYVTQAQAYLINYGYLPSNVLDGVFGPAMQLAVQNFQRRNGLGPDGIVGAKTWAKLESNSSAIVRADGMPNLLGGSNYNPQVSIAPSGTSAGPRTHVDFTDEEGLVITAGSPSPAAGVAAWWKKRSTPEKVAMGAFAAGALWFLFERK